MFDSPLRYPGGKGRLSQSVLDLIEANGLTGGHYIEAYAGGAGIAITLLYLEYASHIHLNDVDPAVPVGPDELLPQRLLRLRKEHGLSRAAGRPAPIRS